MNTLRCVAFLLAALTVAAATSCREGGETLSLGATTSLQDSGILDVLVEQFESASGYEVRPLVADSGQVLQLARRGELDATMTHSPAAEEQLVAEGVTLGRTPFMQNEFVLVGPPDDPAGVAASDSVTDGFRAIAAAGAPFISRGDQSGTNVRELQIWEAAGVPPTGEDWYQQSAVGQGQNLLVASDKGAYTLVDSATFLTIRDRVDLVAFVTDREVANVYSLMLLSPDAHPDVNTEAARAFAEFLASDDALAVIAAFGEVEFGQALFSPVRD